MKHCLPFLSALLSAILMSFPAFSQLNMEFYSEVTYQGNAGNDVWGYVAPDGREYALMGTVDGMSIVDITEPTNPIEIDFIDQQASTWRDIKTWGEFAYVTADEFGTTDGILIIDLSDLPNSISYENNNLEVPGEGIINTCHNIYIDEFGYAYLAGCGDLNAGGLLIWDVKTTPGTPIFAGLGEREYSHDVYVRDNIAYSAEIAKQPATTFSAFDVSDKSNVTLLGSQTTPFNATHNVWLSDDGNTIFTTDEIADAPVASYDVSDLSNIKLLDEYRPSATLNTGVVPHNVHVWEDWLIISYYSDGCIIVDAARPDNLIEVGNFDTFFGESLVGTDFNGAWGAYPFFPSGTVIVGDQENENRDGRLIVLGPTYVRAAYLEGEVTDANTGNPLNNVQISIDAANLLEYTDALGGYKTGYHTAGDYQVTASSFGYESQTKTVRLENGQLSIEDFQLQTAARVNLSGNVVEAGTQVPVPNAKVIFSVEGMEFEIDADANGAFSISDLVASDYEVIAGSWGYKYTIIDRQSFSSSNLNPEMTIEMEKGYEDIFSVDLGWETEFINGSQGEWERGVPIPVAVPGAPIEISPARDSDDFGSHAFVTGNANDFFSGTLIGQAILTSPEFDVTEMLNPVVRYDTWYWVSTFQGDFAEEDFIIFLDNGIDRVAIDTLLFDINDIFTGADFPQWKSSIEIAIKDHLELTPNMKLIVDVNRVGFNSAVEAGFDKFQVYESGSSSTKDIVEFGFNVFPNPSSQRFDIEIPNEFSNQEIEIKVYNLNGQLVLNQHETATDRFHIGETLQAGVYMLKVENSKMESSLIKLVKM